MLTLKVTVLSSELLDPATGIHDLLDTCEAVSYTHLDVYKRQSLAGDFCKPLLFFVADQDIDNLVNVTVKDLLEPVGGIPRCV